MDRSYDLPLTPENLELVRGMIAASDYPDDEPYASNRTQTITVEDWTTMLYCARLLREEAEAMELKDE